MAREALRGPEQLLLGIDEQLLHARLRWLGLSARPWTAEATAAWAREHGVRAEEVVEQRTTEDGEEVTVTLADGVSRVSTAGSLTWAWGGVVTRELEWVATRAAGGGVGAEEGIGGKAEAEAAGAGAGVGVGEGVGAGVGAGAATKRKREGDEGEATARTGATKKKAKKRKKKSRAARRAAKNAAGKDEGRGGS